MSQFCYPGMRGYYPGLEQLGDKVLSPVFGWLDSNASTDVMLDVWSIELIGILDVVIPDATGNVTTQPLTPCHKNGPGNAIEKTFRFWR